MHDINIQKVGGPCVKLLNDIKTNFDWIEISAAIAFKGWRNHFLIQQKHVFQFCVFPKYKHL